MGMDQFDKECKTIWCSQKEFDEIIECGNGVVGIYEGMEIKRVNPDQEFPFLCKGYLVDVYTFDKSKISVSNKNYTKMKLCDTIDEAMSWISEQLTLSRNK